MKEKFESYRDTNFSFISETCGKPLVSSFIVKSFTRNFPRVSIADHYLTPNVSVSTPYSIGIPKVWLRTDEGKSFTQGTLLSWIFGFLVRVPFSSEPCQNIFWRVNEPLNCKFYFICSKMNYCTNFHCDKKELLLVIFAGDYMQIQWQGYTFWFSLTYISPNRKRSVFSRVP